jgi:histidine triad (HIT) family protein
MSSSTCTFCRIADKSLQAAIVWEDADIMVFLDICPVREGHCQIIPKAHYESFELLPAELAAKVVGVGQRLARKMKKLYPVERVAFAFTGNDVAHTHAHVVPMHEKTDVTSARYIVTPNVEFSEQHLKTERAALEEVRSKLQLEASDI